MAKKAPQIARLVPKELNDFSVSSASGQKVSYFGYEFEVPWDDIDPTQTKLYPEANPNKVVLTFRSGLRLSFTALPAKEYVKGLASMAHTSPQLIEAAYGVEATQSDYGFLKRLYELTPEKMNYWSVSPSVHYREGMLLTIKSISLLSWAKGGLFNIQNRDYRGFQQGSPQVHPNGIAVDLYSDDGSVEFIFNQKGYDRPAGVSQPEINRIAQTLRKVQAAPAVGR